MFFFEDLCSSLEIVDQKILLFTVSLGAPSKRKILMAADFIFRECSVKMPKL